LHGRSDINIVDGMNENSQPLYDDQVDDGHSEKAAPPRAPLRAMQILEELAKSSNGTSLARLSEALQLPKTSVFSLLRSLEAGNYVASRNGSHTLAQQAFALASAIVSHDSLAARVRPDLQWLAEQTEETALLAIPNLDWSAVILADQIEAVSSLRFSSRIGSEWPFHSTSIGLALLAFSSPESVKRYCSHAKFTAFTPYTISSVSQLKRTIKQAKLDGYARSNGAISGAWAVAAPVFDQSGSLVASVGVCGPESRVSIAECTRSTLEAARRMSAALGYEGLPSS
jgi:DNA-binding IclR family transcriptional regulator